MKTHRNKRVTSDTLSETVSASVERALEARKAKTELSADEIAQVSGAASLALKFNPEWFGVWPDIHQNIATNPRLTLGGPMLRR